MTILSWLDKYMPILRERVKCSTVVYRLREDGNPDNVNPENCSFIGALLTPEEYRHADEVCRRFEFSSIEQATSPEDLLFADARTHLCIPKQAIQELVYMQNYPTYEWPDRLDEWEAWVREEEGFNV